MSDVRLTDALRFRCGCIITRERVVKHCAQHPEVCACAMPVHRFGHDWCMACDRPTGIVTDKALRVQRTNV